MSKSYNSCVKLLEKSSLAVGIPSSSGYCLSASVAIIINLPTPLKHLIEVCWSILRTRIKLTHRQQEHIGKKAFSVHVIKLTRVMFALELKEFTECKRDSTAMHHTKGLIRIQRPALVILFLIEICFINHDKSKYLSHDLSWKIRANKLFFFCIKFHFSGFFIQVSEKERFTILIWFFRLLFFFCVIKREKKLSIQCHQRTRRFRNGS